MTARGIGLDERDREADLLIGGRWPHLDIFSVILAELRFGEAGRAGREGGGYTDPFHARGTDLRLERRQISADARAARPGVRLVKRTDAFEHRDMVAQPHIDLHRDTRRLIGFLGLVVKKACGRRGERREQDDEANKAGEQAHQPICPG